MPRYFFDFYAGSEYYPDAMGTTLPNIRQARTEALQMIAEIVKEAIPLGDHITTSLAVKAEDRTFLFKVTVSVSIDSEWAL